MLPLSSPARRPGTFLFRPVIIGLLMGAALLAGCATHAVDTIDKDEDALTTEETPSRGGTVGPAEGVSGSAWAAVSAAASQAQGASTDLLWEIFRVPGKQPTQYSVVQQDGRDVVQAMAESTGSILRHRQRVEAADLGRIRFSWKVPAGADGINTLLPQLEDAPVRVVLAFEGDRRQFSFKNSMLNELSMLITGEQMPFATLIYAWSQVGKMGDILVNDRTDRIRKIVVQSGPQNYGQWQSFERDIRADYRQAYGEEPGALLSFAVFTEGERGEGRLQALYGPVTLQPAGRASAALAPQK